MQWDNREKAKKSYETKSYNRPMCNYFSIGVEARIGLGFEKKRTNRVITNKCVYGWEGLKKMCCCSSTTKIKQVIDYACKIDENGQEKVLFQSAIDKDKPINGYSLSEYL